MPSRVVVPESDLLHISGGDWLLVKRRLNHGEYQEMLARKFVNDNGGGVKVDLVRAGWEFIACYLIDWSLVDTRGVQIPIAGHSLDAIDKVLTTLDSETVKEIKDAIAAHREAVEAARAQSKKILDGETGSSATLPSLSGAAGATSGSAV